jgi:hypothetical protein
VAGQSFKWELMTYVRAWVRHNNMAHRPPSRVGSDVHDAVGANVERRGRCEVRINDERKPDPALPKMRA